MAHDTYQSAFGTRYASSGMSRIFSDDHKYATWRKLWAYLAEAQRRLGLGVTVEQVSEMRQHITDIDYDREAEIEAETHHDVMSHIRLYGECCPKAAPIIHYGATSCYVTDNTDVMLMREALQVIKRKTKDLIEYLCTLASLRCNDVTCGYTHLQKAQPTTVGKRITLWAQDFLLDFQDIGRAIDNLRPLGCKGAVGTLASFMQMCDNYWPTARNIDTYVTRAMGFAESIPVSGQTYTRKQDSRVMAVLSGIAQSASKYATDVRLLSGLGEMAEGFGVKQVGSSAMPYKKNPINCERVCALARMVICGYQNFATTAATQWLERSLDDSANRRVMIPEMFMAVDEILDTCLDVAHTMTTDDAEILSHVASSAGNALAEGILMHCVSRGGNRQELHEKLRDFGTKDGTKTPGEYIEFVVSDPAFNLSAEEAEYIVAHYPVFGAASEQVQDFVRYALNVVEESTP